MTNAEAINAVIDSGKQAGHDVHLCQRAAVGVAEYVTSTPAFGVSSLGNGRAHQREMRRQLRERRNEMLHRALDAVGMGGWWMLVKVSVYLVPPPWRYACQVAVFVVQQIIERMSESSEFVRAMGAIE